MLKSAKNAVGGAQRIATILTGANAPTTIAGLLRNLDGKSVADVANAARITPGYVESFEAGRAAILDSKEKARLAAVLRCDVDDLSKPPTPENRNRTFGKF